MSTIKYVLSVCLSFYNVRLSFAPYSFTIWQALLGSAFLCIALMFVKKRFE